MFEVFAEEPKTTAKSSWNMQPRPQTNPRISKDKDRINALLETVQAAVIGANAEGIIEGLNSGAELLFNIQKSAVLGKSVYDLHPPAVAKRIRTLFERFQSDKAFNFATFERQVGERCLQMRFAALRDREGAFQGVTLTLTDQTKNKQMEERLEALEQELLQVQKLAAIGIMASGIAHNLNGPLSVIVGYLDLMYSLHPELQELPLVLAQTERMKEIISNMMIKSRHEQDNHKRTVDINLLLQNELKFLEANLEFKNNIKKQYEFSRGLPLIYGVYSDFSQVFLNLINNALDAMVDSPVKSLQVCTRYDRDNIYVEIADTGCGLEMKEVEQIFKPFYSTKPPVGQNTPGRPCGTGLGLSSSQQLVTKYNGDMVVEGKPGEGAKFTVIIPIACNQNVKRQDLGAGETEQQATEICCV